MSSATSAAAKRKDGAELFRRRSQMLAGNGGIEEQQPEQPAPEPKQSHKAKRNAGADLFLALSLIHISEPTRPY